jgi:antitoxin (DNA-binding transcriptional repressor) of toxin-antitoxin stability system
MPYLQVKDLKKSRELWQRLKQDRELIITRDGRPCAIMIGIEPDELEVALPEIRRALFSTAVGRVRKRGENLPNAEADVKLAIREIRKERL